MPRSIGMWTSGRMLLVCRYPDAEMAQQLFIILYSTVRPGMFFYVLMFATGGDAAFVLYYW